MSSQFNWGRSCLIYGYPLFRPCQLKYYGVIAAVKQLSKSSNVTNNSTNYHSFLTQFVQCKKASRLVYKTLVERKGQTPENSQEKWLLDFNNEPINWKPAYILPFQCTNSRKLIEFQFKLLHRQIPTNTFLTKIGLKDNEKCTFCQKVPEVIIHIFWSCDLISSFWKRVTEWLQSINVISQTDNIDEMTALGLRPDQSKFSRTVNLCCLLTRYYIWISKSKESSPNMNNFLFFVKSQYKLDAKGKAEKKWEPLAAYHPASRDSLNSSMLEGAERETLRKSCHFFEVTAVQISGLVTPVFCRQTGFYSGRIIFCW